MRAQRQSGFTLVEIMIVVIIIGFLAAMAMPAFSKARTASQNSRLANDLRIFAGAIETFTMETGDFPEDSSTGAIPSGLGPYIKASQWFAGPSIGGEFDVEKDSSGIISAVGVHRYTVDESQLLQFDRKYDDGNLSTGIYRKLAGDRYYLVVAE